MAMALTFWAISELMTSICAFGGRLGRAGVDDLDVAEFLGRFFGALVGGVEEAVAERLHDQRDLDVLGIGRRSTNMAAENAAVTSSFFRMLIDFLP